MCLIVPKISDYYLMFLCHLLESIFSIQALIPGISSKKALIQNSISNCEGHGGEDVLYYRYSSCLSDVETRKLCCWVSFWWCKMAFSVRSTNLSLTWKQIADAHQRQNLEIPWHTTMEYHLFQMISNYKTIFPLRSRIFLETMEEPHWFSPRSIQQAFISEPQETPEICTYHLRYSSTIITLVKQSTPYRCLTEFYKMRKEPFSKKKVLFRQL